MNLLDLLVTAVFLVLGGWFLLHNRNVLNQAAVARHIIFMGLVWGGCLALIHGDAIVRWVFGRDIYKGEAKETAAVAVRLGATLLCFAGAAIALGKDRVRQFKLYGETFGVKKQGGPE
jgi:hypothetical protein